MNTLVTGSSGFIGANLVERLKKESHIVVKYDIRESPSYDACYFPRLKHLMEDCEICFHLANHPAHRLSVKNPRGIIYNNFISTLNAVEAARQTDCKKIVFISSFAVYGYQQPPWTEDTPLEPTTPYGMCKIQSECLLKRYEEWYGIDITIIRPSNVFGEHEELHQPLQVIPKWLNDYRYGRPLVVHGSKTTRDFTYVGDVVDGIIKASKCSHPKIFNICSGEPVLLKDVAEKISNKIKVVDLPNHETQDWYGSYEKARKHLGFKPTKTVWEWINERLCTLNSASHLSR